VRFELTRRAEDFAARAERFLAAKIERNVLATVLENVRSSQFAGADPLFACGTDDSGELRAVALRVPPWPLLATDIDASDANTLLDVWLREDPGLPGVNGQPVTARAIAAGWAAITGGSTRVRMREAMHVLEEVRDPPRRARGTLRAARSTERDVLTRWMRAFAEEAGVLGADRAAEIVDAQLSRGRLFVWDDHGPVSLVSISPTIAAVTRIGPVYTAPQRRRRGYASSAVAATSRRALAAGAQRCALFTDLANPTSNKIYADVGYRRLAEWEEHAFERPATP
jgi:predicted GNAT family acetyltransferase